MNGLNMSVSGCGPGDKAPGIGYEGVVSWAGYIKISLFWQHLWERANTLEIFKIRLFVQTLILRSMEAILPFYLEEGYFLK